MYQHYYGHSVEDVDFFSWMMLMPVLIVVSAFAIATGLWVPLLIWAFWPKGKKK